MVRSSSVWYLDEEDSQGRHVRDSYSREMRRRNILGVKSLFISPKIECIYTQGKNEGEKQTTKRGERDIIEQGWIEVMISRMISSLDHPVTLPYGEQNLLNKFFRSGKESTTVHEKKARERQGKQTKFTTLEREHKNKTKKNENTTIEKHDLSSFFLFSPGTIQSGIWRVYIGLYSISCAEFVVRFSWEQVLRSCFICM